ncbi:hypothetical protein OROMI_030969 [Orobanche minor]
MKMIMKMKMKMNGGALINGCRRSLLSSCFLNRFISSTVLCRRKTSNAYAPPQFYYSPLESKIQRILSSEIQYQFDYAPPHQPLAEYDRFMVEERSGEQSITLRGKSDENIRIEATMFDGFVVDQKKKDGTRENVQLHISMSVDIWKGGANSNGMKFVCSAWPNSLEIHNVFIYGRYDQSPTRLYMGPPFKNLNTELQTGFYKFLDTRGINPGLSMFLHNYMMNKDRIELIQWLGKLNCFLNK